MVGTGQVMKRATAALVLALGLLATATAQEGPDRDAFGPAQTAADHVRTTANADIALLPAGMMNREFEGTDLTKLVRYPGDSIVVANLSGAQLLAALNRSISLYPSPNSGFLQVSGIEVVFDPQRSPNERVVSVTVGGTRLADATEYEVAMPISLARGGYGYSSIWDKKAIVRNLDAVTLESVLKGKKTDEQSPRWKKSG
jgi:2',3'-cyclic-nucleotide 2'-phosphodiesterase (5'-nucleotidase family)